MNHNDNQAKYWNSVVEKIAATEKTPSAIAELNNFFKFLEIDNKKGLKVVDVGCGTGRLTIPLLEQGHKVMGTEIAEQNLTELSKICKKKSLGKNLTLVCHDFETAKFQQEFDFAICCNVIHHFDPNKKINILKNIINSLKFGGYLGIIEPNPYCLLYYPWYFLKEICGSDKGRWKVEKEFIHSTPNNLRNFLNDLGMVNIELRYYAFVPSRITNWSKKIIKLNNKLSRFPVLQNFSAFIWIRAKKK